ncbi:M20/M25/M40 family metallo-hydrolase [bacterium]|nr:M20/M25/M40 family metallo-hydrolase [bacterium]MBU1984598.1 M20/M25/M40 family metallo-hydrolase [bacterium]
MRRNPPWAMVALLLLTAGLAAANTEENLRAHVGYLADDARQGRGIGTPGLREAADYIAAEFRSMGLKPAFEGSFFQPFEMGWGVALGPANHVKLGEARFDTSKGIMPLGFSSAATARGAVVFAGYGITAPEYEYDDFAEVQAEGKIVLCMTGEPGEFDTTSVFEGVSYTTHVTLRAKVSNAKLHGATALLVVEGPIYAGTAAEVLKPPRSDEPYMDCGIPAMRVTRATVSALFPEFDLESVQRFIDANTAPRSLELKSDTVEVAVDISRETVEVRNVAGIIPGDSDVIVIGAHYDHLGLGQSGSLDEKPGEVHNGADDNASGVASILEAARILKAEPIAASVLVVAFTAEEVGLGGSRQIVDHFPLSLDHVRIMMNLDMVGRVRENKLTVIGCKTAEEFPSLVDSAAAKTGLEVTCKGDGYGPSDHMNFYLVDKPVLFLFTGAHEDYHRSSDDADKINYADMTRVANFTADLTRAVDAHEQPLTFVKVSEPAQKGGRFRSSFGSIPDFSQPDSLLGMRLSGVREGGPAAQAGLTRGDLLRRLGKVTINNIYDLTYALQIYAPGDTVIVEFVREDELHSTTAILQPSTR